MKSLDECEVAPIALEVVDMHREGLPEPVR